MSRWNTWYQNEIFGDKVIDIFFQGGFKRLVQSAGMARASLYVSLVYPSGGQMASSTLE